jgi:hypothetical protein
MLLKMLSLVFELLKQMALATPIRIEEQTFDFATTSQSKEVVVKQRMHKSPQPILYIPIVIGE